mmetsp:Transcript_53119/g.147315  ORF Transcript_53119/g.147315 Transcript_53119/m.147315 type:complete len:213 (+) Transcript_53119:138-776(+)
MQVDDFNGFDSFEESVGYDLGDTVELVPGGRNLAVTDENKERFLSLLQKHWLKRRSSATSMVKKGMGDVLGNEGAAALLELYSADELISLLRGAEVPATDVMKSLCTYDGYDPLEDDTITILWAVVGKFTDDERAALWHFVTGASRVGPPRRLGSYGYDSRRICVAHGGGPERYPRAATCFSTLYLPEYASESVMRERLLGAFGMSVGYDLV